MNETKLRELLKFLMESHGVERLIDALSASAFDLAKEKVEQGESGAYYASASILLSNIRTFLEDLYSTPTEDKD